MLLVADAMAAESIESSRVNHAPTFDGAALVYGGDVCYLSSSSYTLNGVSSAAAADMAWSGPELSRRKLRYTTLSYAKVEQKRRQRRPRARVRGRGGGRTRESRRRYHRED
jgi:hypothetical protein